MTLDAEPEQLSPLPPYRVAPHFRAAFGGLFGTVNLLVGAISIYNQMIRAFQIGLSPVLRDVFAAYVRIFHGVVDFFAGFLTWFTGFDLMPPEWAHDWIILWFVLAGAAYRLYAASSRVDQMLEIDASVASVTIPPGIAFRFLQFLDARLFLLFALTRRQRLANSLTLSFLYVIVLLIWPWFLYEVLTLAPTHEPVEEAPDDLVLTRISFRLLILLQTMAILLAIFGLSVINVQTMA